jgi:hypothetical protein
MNNSNPNRPPGPTGPSRRQALAALAAAAAAGLLPRRSASQPMRMPGMGLGPEDLLARPSFFFAQLIYTNDLSWNPYPTAARSMMELLVKRTSIPASPDRVDLKIGDPRLFHYPFLYWTGTRGFDPLSESELTRLRLFLDGGGFILVDDAASAAGVGFDAAFSREFARMFPGESLARLPADHTVFQTFYLLSGAPGRTSNRSYLSGLTRGDRTALIYSGNDLSGAWAKDSAGGWLNPVEPGGTWQREQAFRLGVNVVMYALCVDYKKDLIHVPFIEQRRKGLKP